MKERLWQFLARCWLMADRRASMCVVTFHRVGVDQRITPALLRRHLEFLASRFRVILPSEWVGGRLTGRLAMVTIDDCQADTYDSIFPVARELGVPFTICTPTDFFLRGKWLWFNRLDWILARARPGTELTVGGQSVTTGEPFSRIALKHRLRQLSANARDAQIDELAARLGVLPPLAPSPGYRPVPQAAMREMLASGLVEITSHGVTHSLMTRLKDDELIDELTTSKRELEDFSGREVVSFCYPNGARAGFDERTGRALRACGFRLAFTSIEGINRAGSMDLIELRRIHAHSRESVFEKEASGLGDIQRRIQTCAGRQGTRGAPPAHEADRLEKLVVPGQKPGRGQALQCNDCGCL